MHNFVGVQDHDARIVVELNIKQSRLFYDKIKRSSYIFINQITLPILVTDGTIELLVQCAK